MIQAIGNFLWYSIPWWLQITILAIPVLVAIYFAVRIFGFDRVKGWIVPALAILTALGFVTRARQQGYQDRKDIQEKAQEKELDDYKKTEQTIDDKPIDQVDKENDPWLKP